jgi:hypothetical protein
LAIAQTHSLESKQISGTNQTYPEYEHKDGGEMEPDLHRGESNLRVEASGDQEEQESNVVQEDSNTSGEGVSEDENGFESANDQPDDNLRGDSSTDNEHSNGSGDDDGGGGGILGYRGLYN